MTRRKGIADCELRIAEFCGWVAEVPVGAGGEFLVAGLRIVRDCAATSNESGSAIMITIMKLLLGCMRDLITGQLLEVGGIGTCSKSLLFAERRRAGRLAEFLSWLLSRRLCAGSVPNDCEEKTFSLRRSSLTRLKCQSFQDFPLSQHTEPGGLLLILNHSIE